MRYDRLRPLPRRPRPGVVTFDTFVYLRHRNWDVTFVRNFTDVDDKIIARAAETGEEPIELAERYDAIMRTQKVSAF